MSDKITRISDTELEFEKEPVKKIITREEIENKILRAQQRIIRYENWLIIFDQ